MALFLDRWKELTSDQVVFEAVRGFKILFALSPLPRSRLKEPYLFPKDSVLCKTKIQRLIRKDAVMRVEPSDDQFLCFFFVIRKSGGGTCFILNLKDLNSYILSPHFKLEDWYRHLTYAS